MCVHVHIVNGIYIYLTVCMYIFILIHKVCIAVNEALFTHDYIITMHPPVYILWFQVFCPIPYQGSCQRRHLESHHGIKWILDNA